jgi:membrane protease YdiL (CAAX protease family)
MRKTLLFSASPVTLWQNSPVHDIRRIAAYFLAVLALGALLAPWLYWGGVWLGGIVSPLEFLQRVPFSRYFNRAMLVAAVALLWPLIRSLGVRGWSDFGLAPNAHWRRDLAIGFLLAAGLLFALGAVFLFTDLYRSRLSLKWSALPNAALSAAAVSVLEETLFRGALLGLVLRSARSWPAQIFVAALYAIVHFLKPPADAAQLAAELGSIHWLSGFQLLPKVFWQFADPWLLLGGFVTLFLVGLILGFVTQKTRSLWCAIGLHAGWVFGLKIFSAFTAPARPDLLPWVGQNLLIGLGPLITVVITAALLRILIRPAQTDPAVSHEG